MSARFVWDVIMLKCYFTVNGFSMRIDKKYQCMIKDL